MIQRWNLLMDVLDIYPDQRSSRLLAALIVRMGIDHGRSYNTVPQQFLNSAYIVIGLQEMKWTQKTATEEEKLQEHSTCFYGQDPRQENPVKGLP